MQVWHLPVSIPKNHRGFNRCTSRSSSRWESSIKRLKSLAPTRRNSCSLIHQITQWTRPSTKYCMSMVFLWRLWGKSSTPCCSQLSAKNWTRGSKNRVRKILMRRYSGRYNLIDWTLRIRRFWKSWMTSEALIASSSQSTSRSAWVPQLRVCHVLNSSSSCCSKTRPTQTCQTTSSSRKWVHSPPTIWHRSKPSRATTLRSWPPNRNK